MGLISVGILGQEGSFLLVCLLSSSLALGSGESFGAVAVSSNECR